VKLAEEPPPTVLLGPLAKEFAVSTISLPGLSSGVDTTAIISQLIAAERQPQNLMKTQQAAVQKQSTAFGTLADDIDTLKTAVNDLKNAADLRAFTVSTSNGAILTAKTSSSASEGTHEILIDRLASADRKVNAGLASADTLVGAGTFAYTYHGTTRIVQTTDSTTLQNLSDMINSDGGNPGVTANLLQYDAGDGLAMHLVLAGNDTGADYSITIDDAQTTLTDFQAGTFTTTQTAQNARLKVDGYPTGAGWIERSSNTVTDVIAGVTLSLQSTTPDANTPLRLSVTRDTSALKTKLQALVTDYNLVVSYAQEQTRYDATTKTAGVLLGEYSVTNILSQLRTPLTESVTGFQNGKDSFTLAAQIGLSVGQDGKLSLDEDTLDTALSKDYAGVLSLLGANNSGAADGTNLRFYGAPSVTKPGVYDVRATFTDGVITSAQIKLSNESDAAWRDATISNGVIIGAKGQSEQDMQITGTYAGSGTVQTQVRVRQGLAGQMFNTIDKSLASAIDMTEKRYQSQIDLYQKQIDNEDTRLAQLQKQYEAQYARLEQTLALLQEQYNAITGTSSSSNSSSSSSSSK
jgi:flagellar hook-associated protein 2